MTIVEPGRSVSLIKSASKRKRTRTELKEVKGEESILRQDKQQFLMEFKRLKEQNEDLQHQLLELSQADQVSELNNDLISASQSKTRFII